VRLRTTRFPVPRLTFIDHHVLRVHLHSVHRPAARPPEGCRRRAPPHRGDPGALTPHALHIHPGCSSLENLNHGALSTAISPHMHHPTHPSTHPASVRLSIGFHCAFGFGSEARAPVGCTGPRRAIRLTQHCHRAIGIRSVRRCGANLTGSHAPSRLSSRRRSPPRRRPLRRRVFSPSSRRTPLPPLPRRPPPSRLSSRRYRRDDSDRPITPHALPHDDRKGPVSRNCLVAACQPHPVFDTNPHVVHLRLTHRPFHASPHRPPPRRPRPLRRRRALSGSTFCRALCARSTKPATPFIDPSASAVRPKEPPVLYI
jgi:hypothetical protein